MVFLLESLFIDFPFHHYIAVSHVFITFIILLYIL